MSKEITLYIPCYNAENTLERTIRSVLSQTYSIREFFVVDDGSTDNSPSIAARHGVKLIRHSKNMGLAQARNTALRRCKTPFIAAIDSDVEIDPKWLERLMKKFSNDSIAGAGGRLMEKFTLTAVDRWRQVHLSQDKGKKKILNMPYLVGAASVYRVSALRDAGGFDKRYRTNFEDYDMGVRLNKSGLRLVHESQAIARHLRTDDIFSLLNTYRNWSLPFHNLEKRLETIAGIQAQAGLHHIRNNQKLLHQNLRQRKFHLLYPSFLLLLTEILKDIKHFVESNPCYSPLFPFAARIAMEELHRTPNIVPNLSQRVEEDLCAHIKHMPVFRGKKCLLNIREELKKKYPDMDPLTTTSIGLTLEILQAALRARLAEVNRDVFHQIMASADEILFEQKNYPYKKNGLPRPGYRVLLANPPWRGQGRYGVRAGSRWPHTEPFDPESQAVPDYVPFPFFLAYSAAVLKGTKGINPWIIDAIAEGMDGEVFLERVRGFAPDLIVMETSAASSGNDLRLARKLKEISGPSTRIVFAGPHVTSLKEEFLRENKKAVDYLLLGEYELSLKELAACLASGREPSGVQGLLYLEDNKIVGDGRPAPLVDLNKLPLPERLTLPIYNYRDRFAGMPELSALVMSSRGCPFQCSFCCWPQTLYADRLYRHIDPAKVVREMEMLVRDFGFRAIYFDDDTFNIGEKRLLRLCSGIKKRGIETPWAIMARADTTGAEIFQAMKEAGLYAVKFGVESGSQELVDGCGKKLDLGKVLETVEVCKKLGIKTHLTFAIGLPGETRETIRQTIDFALKADPDSAQFSIITPYPGTKIFDMLSEKGMLVTRDWTKYDGTCGAVFRTENFSPQELEKAALEARERFLREKADRVFDDRFSSLVNMAKQGKKIGIFPTGYYARLFLEKYGLLSRKGVWLFDNDPGKKGKKFCGIEVFSPDKIESVSPDYLLILHPAFEEEIYNQVRHLEGKGIQVLRVFGGDGFKLIELK